MPYAINCHLLFKEVPLFERARAAKEAGFDYVEYWWPFSTAVPSESEVTQFIEAIRSSGAQLIGLNLFAGDMPAGERGVVSLIDRVEEFRSSVPIALAIGQELGCRSFNALYGLHQDGADPAEEARVALENLTFAAQAAHEISGTILLEPVSGAPAYPLKRAADCFEVIDRLIDRGVHNVKFLCDLYHLAANGDDDAAVVEAYGSRAGHVQVADYPGRGEPGTGELPLGSLLQSLRRVGYTGYTALEYNPTVPTVDSFAHLPALD